MDSKYHNTSHLWNTLNRLIGFLAVSVVILFGYGFFEESIQQLLNGPKYSDEDLIAMTKERELNRVIEKSENFNLIENGIHLRTGLKDDPNLQLIIGSCTSCHSGKLITQNRATREGWKAMIKWMQETQGLLDLGKNEPIILDYLAKHYAPEKIGRRQNLDMKDIEWYVLELE